LTERDAAPGPVTEGEPPTGHRLFRDILETIVLALVIYAGVRLFIRNFRIDGASMEPTLQHGQLVVIARWSYWFRSPSRGDIVVFRAPNDGARDLIKRVVGLPGEQIEIVDGQVLVDGEAIREPYARPNPSSGGPWKLGEHQVFVMGDNRSRSLDSRNWGPLQSDRIVGKGLFSYWPPGLWGAIRHHSFQEDRS
jgi:signal peptidase I